MTNSDTTQPKTALELLSEFLKEKKIIMKLEPITTKQISDGSIIIEMPKVVVEFDKKS